MHENSLLTTNSSVWRCYLSKKSSSRQIRENGCSSPDVFNQIVLTPTNDTTNLVLKVNLILCFSSSCYSST